MFWTFLSQQDKAVTLVNSLDIKTNNLLVKTLTLLSPPVQSYAVINSSQSQPFPPIQDLPRNHLPQARKSYKCPALPSLLRNTAELALTGAHLINLALPAQLVVFTG